MERKFHLLVQYFGEELIKPEELFGIFATLLRQFEVSKKFEITKSKSNPKELCTILGLFSLPYDLHYIVERNDCWQELQFLWHWVYYIASI